MQELFIQDSSLLLGMDFDQILKAVTYIISVAIGGVGYKFVQLWTNYKTESASHTQKVSENLITNLEDRIKSLNDRVIELEARREESYDREMNLTKMLAKAEYKVETLETKVDTLEKNHKVLEETVSKYYQKFGPLNEAS